MSIKTIKWIILFNINLIQISTLLLETTNVISVQ